MANRKLYELLIASDVQDTDLVPVQRGRDPLKVMPVSVLRAVLRGYSNYELWLAEGHIGTITDYLNSLKGKSFRYEDFTPEQLALLKGEPFTFEDFTPEQLEQLSGSGGGVSVVSEKPLTPSENEVVIVTQPVPHLAFYSGGVWYITNLTPQTDIYFYIYPSELSEILTGVIATKLVISTAITLTGFGEALRMGGGVDGMTIYLEGTFTCGNGTGTIWYGCGSEAGYDYFKIYIDGVRLVNASGSIDVRSVSFDVSAGAHTIRLEYTKDSSRLGYYDGGQVYAIKLPLPL